MIGDAFRTALAGTVLVFPALVFLLVGVVDLVFARPPSERATRRITELTFAVALVASVVSLVAAFVQGPAHVSFGDLLAVPGYHFEITLLVDRLSATMMMLTTAVLLVVSVFSGTYLHRERGFHRFFVLLHLFAFGMLLLVMAGSIDLLYAGWEIVGLTSVLLIAFYGERDAPVRRAFAAFVTYRVCDAGLLLGAVLLHHHARSAALDTAFAAGSWPIGTQHLGTASATTIAFLFLLASLGKGAQLPASGWLPRAMEGPTPSSALFYGALSVHAAVYLLIRMAPVFADAPLARVAMVLVGTATAAYGSLVGRVQTDVKNALAYATMAQIGIMFIEVGLGLHVLAVIHLVLHATLRALQLLRAPAILHDTERVRSAVGDPRVARSMAVERSFPPRLERALYRLALQAFHLDAIVQRFVSSPVVRLAHFVDRIDRRLLALMTFPDESPRPPAGTPTEGSLVSRPTKRRAK